MRCKHEKYHLFNTELVHLVDAYASCRRISAERQNYLNYLSFFWLFAFWFIRKTMRIVLFWIIINSIVLNYYHWITLGPLWKVSPGISPGQEASSQCKRSKRSRKSLSDRFIRFKGWSSTSLWHQIAYAPRCFQLLLARVRKRWWLRMAISNQRTEWASIVPSRKITLLIWRKKTRYFILTQIITIDLPNIQGIISNNFPKFINNNIK